MTDAHDLIKSMKGTEKSEDYNLLLQLIEDIEDINDKTTNKDTQKQMRTMLPSFTTEISGFPEVREVEVSLKDKREKKHQEEMEMLLDKKRRANFLKEQTRQESAKTSEKIELKQSQQRLGDTYQKLSELRDGKVSGNDSEFDSLMNDAASIMKFVKEMKEPAEDELYTLMCKNIKAIGVDKQRKSILSDEEVPILVVETSLEADDIREEIFKTIDAQKDIKEDIFETIDAQNRDKKNSKSCEQNKRSRRKPRTILFRPNIYKGSK